MNLLCLLTAVISVCTGFPVKDLGSNAATNRMAIQRAVDEVSRSGGGKVVIPPGIWTCGSIQLKDGVELHLERGAVIIGSTNRWDYNANDAFPENRWNNAEEWSGGHLVWARQAKNIAITGEGSINGNGSAFFGDCDEDSRWSWYKYGLKLHPIDRDWYRPGWMLAFFGCRNIRISGVTLANTPAWTCHFRCSSDIDVDRVTIDADRTIANSDGFSIDCSRNVRVANSTLRTGDDGFAIRASCPLHSATNFCENIVVTNCDVWSCCYGIRVGIGKGTLRNIEVVDTRIHESAFGFGFSPAWVNNSRNCYIQDVRFIRCTVEESEGPVSVEAPSSGDYRITGIRFSDCRFKTLLPSVLPGNDKVELTFEDCERICIPRLKVRHHFGAFERQIRDKRLVFAERRGDISRIRITNCKPEPFGHSGVLLLSFDDRNFADWEAAMGLFAKYGAHATFFVSGEFDAAATSTAKKLIEAGHAVGLHGEHHANAPQTIAQMGAEGYYRYEIARVRRQCDVAYVPVRNFAYPNCAHNDASDKYLLTKFDRIRTVVPGLRPYDPQGEKRGALKPMIEEARLFTPVSELPRCREIRPTLLGEAYNTDIGEIVACIRRAGERKEVISFISHGIHPDAKGISMKTEWLETILKTAKECGVAVLSFEEIPLK